MQLLNYLEQIFSFSLHLTTSSAATVSEYNPIPAKTVPARIPFAKLLFKLHQSFLFRLNYYYFNKKNNSAQVTELLRKSFYKTKSLITISIGSSGVVPNTIDMLLFRL